MSKMLRWSIKLHIDNNGKLRVTTRRDIGYIYVVEGFKIKVSKDKNYVFPILKIEMQKNKNIEK